MAKFTVWFAGNRSNTETKIAAANRDEARSAFAKLHHVNVSAYIQARAG